jgi:hypothetical protein
LVECNVQGHRLFGLTHAKINETFEQLYEGRPQPAPKRLGEVTLHTEAMLEDYGS